MSYRNVSIWECDECDATAESYIDDVPNDWYSDEHDYCPECTKLFTCKQCSEVDRFIKNGLCQECRDSGEEA